MKPVAPELLRLWHVWYGGEFAWREPYTGGSSYADHWDTVTLEGLSRVRAAVLTEAASSANLSVASLNKS